MLPDLLAALLCCRRSGAAFRPGTVVLSVGAPVLSGLTAALTAYCAIAQGCPTRAGTIIGSAFPSFRSPLAALGALFRG
ncbi:MAG: hypothetical protein Pars92KO_19690 [Parasphingorhabdus sp.]